MRTVSVATVIYFCLFATLEIIRWHVWSFGSDTGTFTQAILAAGNGFRDGPERGSHFLFHLSPILALLYPLLAVTKSPLSLQIAQVALVAATAPALFILFRPYLADRLAALLAILALVYPPLAAIAFGEFHELAFFPVLAVALLWAADRCRWGWFALFGMACLMTREDVCLSLAVIGGGLAILAVLRRDGLQRGLMVGEPRQPVASAIAFGALAIAGAAIAGGYYSAIVTIHGGRWPHNHFYDYAFANGPLGVAAALVLHPATAWPALANAGRLTYVVEALAPLLFLPLRSSWMLAAAPSLAIVLLASEQSVWRMGNHYAALWIPWMLVATGSALMAILARRGKRRAAAWSWAALTACAVVLVAFDPMHPAHYLTAPYPDLAAARSALACVPHDASVSTHDEWFSEIAATYPNATIQTSNGPQFLVYADDFPNDRFAQSIRPALAAEVGAGAYRAVCSFGRVKTYERQS